MSRHTMLAQYDQAMRDRITKYNNLQRRYERIFKKSDEPDEDEDETDNGDADHVVSQIADLLAESGQFTREQALHFLLNTAHGGAILARLRAVSRKRADTGKGFTMPTRQEVLKGYLKAAGSLDKLATRIVKRGTTDITEHELTALAVAEAKRLYPDIKDDARAFAKMFTDAGPTGAALRQAVQIAKVAQVGGDDGDADDAAAAMEELHRLAEQHQRSNPELTPQQSFARIFADPKNAALAHRAHRRPVANEKMLYPFPR